MASIIVLFGKPQNPQEFDELYWKEHVPMAKKMPGLKRFTVHKVSAPPGRETFDAYSRFPTAGTALIECLTLYSECTSACSGFSRGGLKSD